MPTAEFKQASNAVETEEIFLMLLDFTHPEIVEPLYFVNNTVEIISNGVTYQPYPFRVTLPEDTEGVLPEVKLTIDNVDRQLTEAIRGFNNPPEVTLKVILASAPDTVEMQIDNLKLRNINFDAFTISGALIIDSPMSRRFPASRYNPKQYPALFYR